MSAIGSGRASKAKRSVFHTPKKYKATIRVARLTAMNHAEAWAYLNPKSRDVYVQVSDDSGALATVHVRIPR